MITTGGPINPEQIIAIKLLKRRLRKPNSIAS